MYRLGKKNEKQLSKHTCTCIQNSRVNDADKTWYLGGTIGNVNSMQISPYNSKGNSFKSVNCQPRKKVLGLLSNNVVNNGKKSWST